MIGDKGAIAISGFLMNNHTLRLLNLNGRRMTDCHIQRKKVLLPGGQTIP